jgi:hypothetical protein
VSITTHVSNTPGYSGADCYTGWDSVPGMITAQELVF